MRGLPVDLNLESVLSRLGERHVEYQHGTGFDLSNAGGRFPELNASFAADQLGALLIHEPNPDRMSADLHPLAPDPEHQVSPGVDRRKGLDPDVLKDPHHGKLPVLIHQGVVGQDCEIDDHGFTGQIRALNTSVEDGRRQSKKVEDG